MEPDFPPDGPDLVDVSKVVLVDHLLIRDRDSGRVLVNKRGSGTSIQDFSPDDQSRDPS